MNTRDNGSSLILDPSAADYGTRVLSFKKNPDDEAAITGDQMTDQNKKNVLAAELVTCSELVSTWSDSTKVVDDCQKLLKSAGDEISSPKGNLILAYSTLIQVRQRLSQAWRSRRGKGQVVRVSLWLLFVFAGCVSTLVVLQLLPGATPRVASSNLDVAALFSSFLFGAIGGIFDAALAMSASYTENRFDTSHSLWYIFSPFLGGILGVVVFAVILAGLLTTTGSGVSGAQAASAAGTAAAASTPDTTKAAFILFVAFVAGFKQITAMGLLERIANAVFGGSAESKK